MYVPCLDFFEAAQLSPGAANAHKAQIPQRHEVVHTLSHRAEVSQRYEDTQTPVPLTSALSCYPLPHACAWGRPGTQLLPHCRHGCGLRHQALARRCQQRRPRPRPHCRHGCGLRHQALPGQRYSAPVPTAESASCSKMYSSLAMYLSLCCNVSQPASLHFTGTGGAFPRSPLLHLLPTLCCSRPLIHMSDQASHAGWHLAMLHCSRART